MNDTRIFGRRQVLAGAGAAGAVAVLGGATRASVASADEGGVAGAYFITVTTTSAGGGSPFQSILALASGGVAIGTDGNAQTSTDLGGWEASGDRGFKLRFFRFQFDSSGNGIGYITIDAKGAVDGDDVKGTFKVTLFLTGQPSKVVAVGTFAGRSIEL